MTKPCMIHVPYLAWYQHMHGSSASQTLMTQTLVPNWHVEPWLIPIHNILT